MQMVEPLRPWAQMFMLTPVRPYLWQFVTYVPARQPYAHLRQHVLPVHLRQQCQRCWAMWGNACIWRSGVCGVGHTVLHVIRVGGQRCGGGNYRAYLVLFPQTVITITGSSSSEPWTSPPYLIAFKMIRWDNVIQPSFSPTPSPTTPIWPATPAVIWR